MTVSQQFIAQIRIHKIQTSFCVLLLSFSFACSVPNLEGSKCATARDSVSRFYWLRFGTVAGVVDDFPKQRNDFLTKRLIAELGKLPNDSEYFSPTEDAPKTFRIGVCREVSADELDFQLLFFWKTDTRNEQRESLLRVIRQNDKWLIDSVAVK
jgi:hypothetical protein